MDEREGARVVSRTVVAGPPVGAARPGRRNARGWVATVLAGALIASAVTIGVPAAVVSAAVVSAAQVDTIGVPLASSTFAQPMQNGWAPADLGGAWTGSDGRALVDQRSVANGAGRFVVNPGRSTQAILRGASATDVTLRSTFTIPLPTGGPVYHGLTARVQADGSAYRVRYVIRPDGSAVLSTSKFSGGQETYLGDRGAPGLAGQPVTLTMTVTGSDNPRIVARLSAATSADVAAQSDVTDTTSPITGTGAVGLWSYLGGSASPVTISTTSFVATRAIPAPGLTTPRGVVALRDDFDRSVGIGWGGAPGRPAWTVDDAAAFSVDPSGALTTVQAGRSSRASTPATVQEGDVQTVFAFGGLPANGGRFQHSVAARVQADGTGYRGRISVDAAGSVRLGVTRSAGSTDSDLGDQAAGFVLKAGEPVTLEMMITGGSPVRVTVMAKTASMSESARFGVLDDSDSRITAKGTTGIATAADAPSARSAVIVTRSFAATELPGPQASSTSREAAGSTSPAPSPTSPPATTTSAPAPASTTPATLVSGSLAPSTSTTAPSPTGTTVGSSSSTPAVPSTSAATPTSVTPPATSTSTAPDPGTPSPGPQAGARQPGGTSYPVPGDALFVASNGSDGANGSSSAPLQKVQTAVNRARSGQTIVLRAGTYHESVLIPQGKALTLQAYPGEAVWFDGSSPVTRWAPQGTTWVAENWAAAFDASPTFTRGAADGTSPGWRFIDPAYPMAAHPDQVWIDGVPQQQVATASEVRPGSFAVDYSSRRLILGSDPTGRQVRASDLSTGIKVVGEGSVLRGFGVRNYAPSVPDFGALSVWRPRVTVENVVISDSATIGLSVNAQGAVVRQVSVLNNGLMGVHVNYADDLLLDGVLARGNNDEKFNQVPAAGGIKITRSRNVTVQNSVSTGNNATGLWFDESVYNIRILRNDLSLNLRHGLVVELSSKVVVAGNTVTGNASDGILIVNSSDSRIWNNTVGGNKRNINLTQDARRASNAADAGHDPRQPFPDPTMTWTISPAVVSNNVIIDGNGASDALVGVQDFTKQMSAEQMGVTLNGNFYFRSVDASPRWVVAWSRGGGQNPFVATQLDAFVQATGQEKSSSYSSDRSMLDASGKRLTDAARARLVGITQPLPADISSALGWTSGTRRVGS